MTDYGVLFTELAVPRLVGTPNHSKVREALIRELEARGFTVEAHRFIGRPARALFGVPAVIEGTNLIAHRPSGRPTERPSVWLVAHYDSKGQPISMWVRLAGFTLVALGVLLLLLSWIAAVVTLGMGLAIVSQNRVNDNSPGALDNASAVITVLMTIDQVPRDAAVGIVFPDAEEFGLAGARALVAERAALFKDSAIINLDGIDDIGGITAFAHRPGPIGDAVTRELEASRWRWLPVVVDGIALARVARDCVTILKGNIKSMEAVHTPHDTTARLRLDGAAQVAAGLARVLRDR
ncbi:MAG TPA: M28 family peptidase [Gemmatimonadales bacterium]|nr:M28 family peptidase [Gemmatimonadales bacterium]